MYTLKNVQKIISMSLIVVLGFIAQTSWAAKPSKILLKSTRNILNKSQGLKEPSGLTFSHRRKALWLVSDDTSKIFKLKLNGKLKKKKTIIDLGLKGLEGITISNDGLFLYVVKEQNNSVVTINIADKSVDSEILLSELSGYSQMVDQVPDHFDPSLGGNNGLEGITIHPQTGSMYLLKETGLLIEVSIPQNSIVEFYDLDFSDDYSGVCFEDANKNRLWIISDQAKKIHLFDLDKAAKIKSFKLKNDSGKSYASAEGVAYNRNKKILYIVTDQGHRLRTYKVKYR